MVVLAVWSGTIDGASPIGSQLVAAELELVDRGPGGGRFDNYGGVEVAVRPVRSVAA
jgi:hypothetical protein